LKTNRIPIIGGDITKLKVEAVVTAANADLIGNRGGDG
jgi:O-acetyl-ADP-ribose deacetylase (regulator of RNase III)